MAELQPKSSEVKISPEKLQQLGDEMCTVNWNTREVLWGTTNNVEFIQVERDLPEPSNAAEVRRQTWNATLQKRLLELSKHYPDAEYLIILDDQGDAATGENALFERLSGGELKRKMWAGTTLTLAQQPTQRQGSNLQIPVYPINYSEWVACLNPRFARAYYEQRLPAPYAGIGVSVLMETQDGFIPLTKRGIETSVYPGRLYSPGGGPKPGQNSVSALLEEIVEETGLEEGNHFNPADLTMLAFVDDALFENSPHARPEVIAHLPINVGFRQLEEIQLAAALKRGMKETDVWGLRAFSTFPETFAPRLMNMGTELCPPTEAGLAHFLARTTFQNGKSNPMAVITQFMDSMRNFRDRDYNFNNSRLALSKSL